MFALQKVREKCRWKLEEVSRDLGTRYTLYLS
jgi:hypothetical protein